MEKENPSPDSSRAVAYFGSVDSKLLASLYSGPDLFVFCSDGGDLHTMMAAVDYLEADPSVSVQAVGCCFSAAVPILACAGVRRASKNTRFLCHPMTITGEGSTGLSESKADLQEMEWLDKRYIEILAYHTKKPKKFWQDLCTKSVYFGVKEAKRWGLIDKVF